MQGGYAHRPLVNTVPQTCCRMKQSPLSLQLTDVCFNQTSTQSLTDHPRIGPLFHQGFNPLKSFTKNAANHSQTNSILLTTYPQASKATCLLISSFFFSSIPSAAAGKSPTSKITRIIRLQLGHTAISSPSLRSAMLISKRSPQGQG